MQHQEISNDDCVVLEVLVEEQAVELPQAPRIACLENCSLLNVNALDLLMIRAHQPTPGQLWNETDPLIPRHFLTPCLSRSLLAKIAVGR